MRKQNIEKNTNLNKMKRKTEKSKQITINKDIREGKKI